MKNNYLHIGDIILISSLLSVSIILLVFQNTNRHTGQFVLIQMAPNSEKKINLDANQQIKLKNAHGTAIVQIQNHRARIVESSCPHQYCVQMGWIDKIGEMAICIPNRLIIEIVGDRQANFDALTM